MRNSYNDCKDEIHSGHLGMYILLHVFKKDDFIIKYFIITVQNSTLVILCRKKSTQKDIH